MLVIFLKTTEPVWVTLGLEILDPSGGILAKFGLCLKGLDSRFNIYYKEIIKKG